MFCPERGTSGWAVTCSLLLKQIFIFSDNLFRVSVSNSSVTAIARRATAGCALCVLCGSKSSRAKTSSFNFQRLGQFLPERGTSDWAVNWTLLLKQIFISLFQSVSILGFHILCALCVLCGFRLSEAKTSFLKFQRIGQHLPESEERAFREYAAPALLCC